MSKVAVLTNDLQYDLVQKNIERIEAVGNATRTICDFLDKMRSLEVPIIHLQLINNPDDPNAERYGSYLPVIKGSEGARIIAEFLHKSDIVIEKNKDSGFYETELEKTLKELGINTVIITGMQTQICVQTTAADAFFRGFKVIIPEDAVVSAREEDKERALDWLDSYCAQVLTCEEIYERLKEHEDFEPKKIYIA